MRLKELLPFIQCRYMEIEEVMSGCLVEPTGEYLDYEVEYLYPGERNDIYISIYNLRKLNQGE